MPSNSRAHIEIEHWEGPRPQRECVENPSVSVLHERLSGLDGNRTDCLSIEVDGVGALSVGGGPDKFLVISFPADGSSAHVETGVPQPGQVELRLGGQQGAYARDMVLPAHLAFPIAERFLSAGEYDRSLRWVQDWSVEGS
jgi:hypothetical protein